MLFFRWELGTLGRPRWKNRGTSGDRLIIYIASGHVIAGSPLSPPASTIPGTVQQSKNPTLPYTFGRQLYSEHPSASTRTAGTRRHEGVAGCTPKHKGLFVVWPSPLRGQGGVVRLATGESRSVGQIPENTNRHEPAAWIFFGKLSGEFRSPHARVQLAGDIGETGPMPVRLPPVGCGGMARTRGKPRGAQVDPMDGPA